MADYLLNYTGSQINSKLAQIKTDTELATIAQEALPGAAVSSTTVTGNGFTAYLYKFGRIGYISVIGGSLSAAMAANGVILTVPAAYKPIQTLEMNDTYNATKHRIRLTAAGNVDTTGALGSGVNLRFSGCYITAT